MDIAREDTMNQEEIIQRYSSLLAQSTYDKVILEVQVKELMAENEQLNQEIEELKDNTEDDRELEI